VGIGLKLPVKISQRLFDPAEVGHDHPDDLEEVAKLVAALKQVGN
jgi:hypothetical protein